MVTVTAEGACYNEEKREGKGEGDFHLSVRRGGFCSSDYATKALLPR
jgi:hypothetical protein